MKKVNKEIWKNIPNYMGLYLASNWGNIKCLYHRFNLNQSNIKEIISMIDNNISVYKISKKFKTGRTTIYKIKNSPAKYLDIEKILKQSIDKNGYSYVTLYKNGEGKHKYVHRLVLETFIGPCPLGMEGCHNNGNPPNNSLNNLRYDTPKGNSLDKVKHKTLLYGSRCPWTKLDEGKIREIKKLLKEGKLTQREIAERFNVCQQAICDINTGKTWKHII
jgi:predicted transcriptional regulator